MSKPGWMGSTGITDPGDPPEAIPVDGAYEVVKEKPACPHCGEGETWTVKAPDGVLIGQSWTGDDAECEAEEMAQALNGAYDLWKEHR